MTYPCQVQSEWNPFLRMSAPVHTQREKKRNCGLGSPVFNLLRHGQKGLLYICGILRRSFEEGDGKLVSKFLGDQRVS